MTVTPKSRCLYRVSLKIRLWSENSHKTRSSFTIRPGLYIEYSITPGLILIFALKDALELIVWLSLIFGETG